MVKCDVVKTCARWPHACLLCTRNKYPPAINDKYKPKDVVVAVEAGGSKP